MSAGALAVVLAGAMVEKKAQLWALASVRGLVEATGAARAGELAERKVEMSALTSVLQLVEA